MPPFLANKRISLNYILLFVLLAIFFRSYQEYLLADFPPDKRIQTATALNFSSGHGISIAYANSEDLSKIDYEKIGLWPPGFPIAVASFMSLGFTFFQASFVLEVIAISVLFFSLYGIFKLLKNAVLGWIPICFIIFQAFTLGIYKISFTNDLVALSFSVCALYLLLKIIQGGNRRGHFLLFGIISFAPSFFRFSYYPVSLLFPFLLLLYAIFSNKKCLTAGLISLFITGSLISLQLFYQSTLPEGLSYLNEYYPEDFSEPYWKNLFLFVDLPVELLTDKYLFKRSLDQIHPSLFLIFSSVALVVFMSAVLGLFFRITLGIKKYGSAYLLRPKNQFLIAGLTACFVVIGFLSLLSLRYPPAVADWMTGKEWTYVAEARYFNLSLFLFPLLFLIGFQDLLKMKWIRFITIGIVMIFLTFSMGVNLYYFTKYGGNDLKENAFIYYHYHQDLEDYLKTRQSSTAEESLLYAPIDKNDGYGIYASLLQIPLVKMEDLEGGINSKGPVCILLNLNESQRPETKECLQSLISNYQLQPIREFPDLQVKLYELCLP